VRVHRVDERPVEVEDQRGGHAPLERAERDLLAAAGSPERTIASRSPTRDKPSSNVAPYGATSLSSTIAQHVVELVDEGLASSR
jgi:hypothetical protein